MSECPAECQPVVCSHRWFDPNAYPRRIVSSIIDNGPGFMQPGKTYVCQGCRSTLYIKHRGTLISTVPDTNRFVTSTAYITPSRFAASCICGLRIPAYGYFGGMAGKEYALSRMRAHVERCNKHRVSHEHQINFYSQQA